MPDRPAQPPEGRLIGVAADRDGRSVRQLAAKAGISDSRWRHIVTGYQPAGRGNFIPVVAPADTLARMARVVGVSADQLAQAGRVDAADELARRTLPGDIPDDEDLADAIKVVLDDPDLTEDERDYYIRIAREDWERERGEARRRIAEKTEIRLEERRRRTA